MPKVTAYEPAMCCSTGVCGPNVDQTLVDFLADLQWLQRQGIEVERNNLSHQPQAFVQNTEVQKALAAEGTACLPLIMIGDKPVFSGAYPTRKELAAALNLKASNELRILCCDNEDGCC